MTKHLILAGSILFMLIAYINNSYSQELKFANKELEELYYSADGPVIFLENSNGVITSVTVLRSDKGGKFFIYWDPERGCYWVAKNQKLRILAWDDIKVETIDVSIDGGEAKTYKGDATAYFSVGDSGEHTVTFRATDSGGNIEKEKTVKICVDPNPPVIKWKYLRSTKVLMPLVADNMTDHESGLAKVEYKIDDDEEWCGLKKEGISLVGLDKGTKIHIRATDNVGNVKILTLTVGEIMNGREGGYGDGFSNDNPPVSNLDTK